MESKLPLILLDLLVLGALGWTMYYMRRISGSIKVIREGKTEMQQLLQQLNVHVSNAQHAIENMNKLADSKAKIMQKNIEEASAVIDELQFIQKAADNVALRLEKLTRDGSAPIRDEEPKRATPQAPARTISKAEKELADAMAARRAKGQGE